MTRVLVNGLALAQIERHVREKPGLETGGFLLGSRHALAPTEVFLASGPGEGADHGDLHFQADASYSQGWADALHEATGGRVVYLGEWHSHPVPVLEPSPHDLESLRDMARDTPGHAPLMLIAALRQDALEVRLFQLEDGEAALVEIDRDEP